MTPWHKHLWAFVVDKHSNSNYLHVHFTICIQVIQFVTAYAFLGNQTHDLEVVSAEKFCFTHFKPSFGAALKPLKKPRICFLKLHLTWQVFQPALHAFEIVRIWNLVHGAGRHQRRESEGELVKMQRLHWESQRCSCVGPH